MQRTGESETAFGRLARSSDDGSLGFGVAEVAWLTAVVPVAGAVVDDIAVDPAGAIATDMAATLGPDGPSGTLQEEAGVLPW